MFYRLMLFVYKINYHSINLFNVDVNLVRYHNCSIYAFQWNTVDLNSYKYK